MSLVLSALRHTDSSNPLAASERGDACGFARELVLAQPRLARLVQRLLGWPVSGTEVEDIVQEVLVSAWAARGRFRGDSELATWLTRIALNQVRRHRRSWLTRARRLSHHGDLGDVAAPDQPAGEHLERVRAALGRLSHRDREVLVLHYLEGRAIVDMATLLRLRRNAVEARLSRARRRLRPFLAPGDGDER